MRLGELLENIHVEKLEGVFLEEEVKGVTENSKEVKEGYLFVAIKGERLDGHDFVKEALSRGAVAAVVEKPGFDRSILVRDTREALGFLASRFYGNPSERLKVVGVTGTNGKSSTVYLLKMAFESLEVPAGFVGTLGASWGEKSIPLPNTTPSPVLINRLLRDMANEGVKYVFMEVSSHAIKQKRIEGIKFSWGIFTKGGRDHLDYHGTLEDYKNTKKSFIAKYPEKSIVNFDDPWGRELKEELKNVITISVKSSKGDYTVRNYKLSEEGIEGELFKKGSFICPFFSPLVGFFNLYNILNVASFLCEEGFEDHVSEALSSLKPVPGRLERVIKGVYIDYAHTPDALRELLRSLRAFTKGRIIVVFGCGGNRDRGKRPQMGRIAEKMADVALVTSDNPRREDPMMIIDDILSGLVERPVAEKEVKKRKRGVFANPDRRWTIEFALRLKEEGDVVVVAGKGHEDYMELGGKKIPFSDREVILEKAKKVFGKGVQAS